MWMEFARSIEYLPSAQYATESNQVQGDLNHFVFRRVTGRQYQGTTITAGLLKDPEKVQELLKTDNAYKFLKNVRGSPAYYQKVFSFWLDNLAYQPGFSHCLQLICNGQI